MFGEARPRCHVRTGAGSCGAARPGGEQSGGGHDVVGVELAPLGHHVEREVLDRRREFVELAHPPLAEFVVLESLFEDDPDHPGEQCRVLAGADLQVDVGERRQLGAARVDDDQLHALGLAATHDHERVGALQAADRTVRRHHRVVADRHVDVGVGEVVVARLPTPESERGQPLRRLIDGDRGVERHRVEALMEGARRRHRDRVLVAAGAGVRRHGSGAVGVDDPPEFVGDLVERLSAGHLLERAVGAAPQRGSETVRIGHLVRELTALDARVSLEQRIVEYAAHGNDLVVGDVDLHRTTRMANATERGGRRDVRRTLAGRIGRGRDLVGCGCHGCCWCHSRPPRSFPYVHKLTRRLVSWCSGPNRASEVATCSHHLQSVAVTNWGYIGATSS